MTIVVTTPFEYPDNMRKDANSLMVHSTIFVSCGELDFIQVDHCEFVYQKEAVESNKKLGWFGCWKIKQLK